MRPAPDGPMNAYAWATRSLASARRSSSTARGWSWMRSSATQELLDDRPHLAVDDGRRLRCVDHPHPLGLRALDLEIAATHASEEGERLALDAVESPALRAVPLEPSGRVQIEEQGQVRHDAAGRARVELADQVQIDAAAVALVGHRRVDVPIAEHDPASVEPRAELLGDVLLARRHEEEDFDEGLRMDTRALEQTAHGDSQPCAVWLPCALDLTTAPTKPPLEPHHLGC